MFFRVFVGLQNARQERNAVFPSKLGGESRRIILGRRDEVAPLQFAHLVGIEVSYPIIVHRPRIHIGSLGNRSRLVTTRIDSPELHQRNLLTAHDNLRVAVSGCRKILHRVPVVGRTLDLVHTGLDIAAGDVEMDFAVFHLIRESDIDRLRVGNGLLAQAINHFDFLFHVVNPEFHHQIVRLATGNCFATETVGIPDIALLEFLETNLFRSAAEELRGSIAFHRMTAVDNFVNELAHLPFGILRKQISLQILVEQLSDSTLRAVEVDLVPLIFHPGILQLVCGYDFRPSLVRYLDKVLGITQSRDILAIQIPICSVRTALAGLCRDDIAVDIHDTESFLLRQQFVVDIHLGDAAIRPIQRVEDRNRRAIRFRHKAL